MKRLFLILAVAALSLSASADTYNLTKVWELSASDLGLVTNECRQGFGMNGKFYINNKIADGVQVVYVIDQNGMTSTSYEGGLNCGITRDEAGNIIVSNAAFPTSMWMEATIKVINPASGDVVEYTVPQECGLLGRCDFIGFAKGNMLEDGQMYLTGGNTGTDPFTDGVAIFTVTDGEVDIDNCYLASVDAVIYTQTSTVINYYQDINGDDAIIHAYRSGAPSKLTWDGDNFTKASIALPAYNDIKKGACNGIFPIVWDGKELFIYPLEPNYRDGWAIAEDGAVAPIAAFEATVAANPNSIQANWLNAEVNADGSMTIYQYVPGLCLRVFSLTKEGAQPQGLRGDVNGDSSIDPADISALIDYLLNGNEVNEENSDCDLNGSIDPADISALIDYLLNEIWPE